MEPRPVVAPDALERLHVKVVEGVVTPVSVTVNVCEAGLAEARICTVAGLTLIAGTGVAATPSDAVTQRPIAGIHGFIPNLRFFVMGVLVTLMENWNKVHTPIWYTTEYDV